MPVVPDASSEQHGEANADVVFLRGTRLKTLLADGMLESSESLEGICQV